MPSSASLVGMTRFRDSAIGLRTLAAHGVDVVCPRCHSRARATSARLTCPACTYTATFTGRCTRWGGPVDPWFAQPVWFQASCRGRRLWALNEAHLDLLETYVTARLRERYRGPSSMTMLARLPRWIKAAENRDHVRTAITRLRARRTAPHAGSPGRSRGFLVIYG